MENTWLCFLVFRLPSSHGSCFVILCPSRAGCSEAYSLFTLLDLARFPVSEVSPVLLQAFSRTRTSSLSSLIPACLIRKYTHLIKGSPIPPQMVGPETSLSSRILLFEPNLIYS